jgi:hypothetical protein
LGSRFAIEWLAENFPCAPSDLYGRDARNLVEICFYAPRTLSTELYCHIHAHRFRTPPPHHIQRVDLDVQPVKEQYYPSQDIRPVLGFNDEADAF